MEFYFVFIIIYNFRVYFEIKIKLSRDLVQKDGGQNFVGFEETLSDVRKGGLFMFTLKATLTTEIVRVQQPSMQ